MTKTKIKRDTRQFVNVAWMRNGTLEVTGEALILACLLKSKGAGRDSKDMRDVQRIMKDHNLDKDE